MTDPILTPEVYGDDYKNPQGIAVAKARMASVEPRKQRELPRGTALVTIQIRAAEVSESAVVAYWLESHGDKGTFDYHRNKMVEKLREVADLLGFDLVAR